MRRMLSLTFAIAGMLCGRAFAEDIKSEGTIDANFTIIAHDIVKVPGIGDAASTITESDLVSSDKAGGPFGNLGGHCIGFGPMNNKTFAYEMTGTCTYQDVSGDKLVENYKEASNGSDPTQGTAKIVGGTGKFAGLTGDITYTTQFYASTRDGFYHLSGQKKGSWHRVTQ